MNGKEKAIEVALASAMEAHQAVADVANTRWIPSERNQYREGYKHGFDAGWDAHADMSTPSTEALFDAPCDECEHPDHCRTDGCWYKVASEDDIPLEARCEQISEPCKHNWSCMKGCKTVFSDAPPLSLCPPHQRLIDLGLTLSTGDCIACKLNKADELEYQIKQTETTISTLVTVLELAESELVMLYKKTGIRGHRVLNVITSVLGDTKEKI